MNDVNLTPRPRPGVRQDDLSRWLAAALAETLHADEQSIRRDVPLGEYGMDSLVAASLLAEIDDVLGVWVDPADIAPGISLDELAAIVVGSVEFTQEVSDVA